MKIFLIISANAIGDTYLSLSGAKELKKIFPDSQIDFFIKSNSIFLFSGLEMVNNLFVYNNIYDLLSIRKKIVKRKYDYSLNFFPGRLNTMINLFSNAKIKSGYWNLLKLKDWSSSKQIVNSNLSSNLKIVWKDEDSYLDRINLVFQSIKLQGEISTKFIYPEFKNICKETNEYYLIHTCSRFQHRSLSNHSIKELIYFLREKNKKKMIILCSRGDHNFNFLNSLSCNEIKILADPSISDLVNVIINAKLFIGVDSFPIHLADAYNGSFLGIFGPTNSTSVLTNYNKSIQFKTISLENITNHELLEAIKNKINGERLN